MLYLFLCLIYFCVYNTSVLYTRGELIYLNNILGWGKFSAYFIIIKLLLSFNKIWVNWWTHVIEHVHGASKFLANDNEIAKFTEIFSLQNYQLHVYGSPMHSKLFLSHNLIILLLFYFIIIGRILIWLKVF